MSYGGLNARQAANEHALAVTRDFISQPRLSKSGKFFHPYQNSTTFNIFTSHLTHNLHFMHQRYHENKSYCC
jgi:hypothetical protein